MRTPVASVVAATMIALAACGGDDPGGPSSNPDIASFEIRRSGALVYEWEGTVGADDTVRLAAGDSIPVEFRFFDGAGDRINLPASADLSVTTQSMGVARWVPHPSDEEQGSFVTATLLQPVTTAMQVRLEIGSDAEVSTSLIPVKVSP